MNALDMQAFSGDAITLPAISDGEPIEVDHGIRHIALDSSAVVIGSATLLVPDAADGSFFRITGAGTNGVKLDGVLIGAVTGEDQLLIGADLTLAPGDFIMLRRVTVTVSSVDYQVWAKEYTQDLS